MFTREVSQTADTNFEMKAPSACDRPTVRSKQRLGCNARTEVAAK